MNDKKKEEKAAGVINFNIPSMSQGIPMVVLAAIVVTTAIFLLIPFTQLLDSIGKKDSLVVQVDIAGGGGAAPAGGGGGAGGG